jgi:hypothetical protein
MVISELDVIVFPILAEPRTDSLVLSLDDQARAGFLNDIAALIDGKYDGSVARNFVYDVITART